MKQKDLEDYTALPKRNWLEILYDWFFPSEETESGLTHEETEAVSPYEKSIVKKSTKITENADIVLFEPRDLREVEEIGKNLKSGKACCVNLHRIPNDYRQRVYDFLYGIIYGIEGTIEPVGSNVILCTPKNLEVAGRISLRPDTGGKS